MALITGTLQATDANHTGSLTGGDLRTGSFSATDLQSTGYFYGVVIGDSTRNPNSLTYTQGQPVKDMTLTFYNRRFSDGSYSDGTYFDSTYLVRNYNPIWLNYSIWYLTPPDSSTAVLQGTRTRTADNTRVGYYNTNMMAPEPGRYELRWRFQKDTSSYAKEIVQPFTVNSWGLTSNPDYS